ncbi:MAG: hypothetical protein ABS81_14585 [Pseudonocardia sp. SCN 72-86]|mgnify:CR=1 FL=1|nr:MAG: hypothetical protein ABS81_14585 [Pseudonocardia sp. SCN 72-86]
MPDRPTSSLTVLRMLAGDYLFAGAVGALCVNTPTPMRPEVALRHARILAPLLSGTVIHVSNVTADDGVVAALRGGR